MFEEHQKPRGRKDLQDSDEELKVGEQASIPESNLTRNRHWILERVESTGEEEVGVMVRMRL